MPELVRAYPLALGQATPDLLCVSGVLLPAMQAALDASWQEASFVLMAANGPAYKVAAATGLCPVQQALPSRVRRAVQEVAGRMLRSQAQRCTIYGVLRQPDGALASAIADRQALSEAPLLLVRNVAECMGNAVRRGAALPPDYTTFQAAPQTRTAVLTAAADDGPASGQFFRYGLVAPAEMLNGQAVDAVWCAIKTPGCSGTWEWSERCTLLLPAVVSRKLDAGWRLAAPDIRVRADGQAFFDLKVAVPRPALQPLPEPEVRRTLGVDWGITRLVVLQAIEGTQRLGLPVYFHEHGLLAKLDEMRTHARRCQRWAAQAWQLALLTTGAVQAALRVLWTARSGEKRSLWAKYRRIQETLAQNAALSIVRRALELGCDTIAVEALGGLRSQDKGPAINWKVNAQIRAFTHQRVVELAAEHGLRVKLVSPHQTSLSCPQCRALGTRTASPEHRVSVDGGPWFRCGQCGYNASADYVAATNIALLGAHAGKGQRIAAMPAVQRTLIQQRRLLLARLRWLLRARGAVRSTITTPASYTGTGPVLPLPLGRARQLAASRHHGYPQRIRLSQQRGFLLCWRPEL